MHIPLRAQARPTNGFFWVMADLLLPQTPHPLSVAYLPSEPLQAKCEFPAQTKSLGTPNLFAMRHPFGGTFTVPYAGGGHIIIVLTYCSPAHGCGNIVL